MGALSARRRSPTDDPRNRRRRHGDRAGIAAESRLTLPLSAHPERPPSSAAWITGGAAVAMLWFGVYWRLVGRGRLASSRRVRQPSRRGCSLVRFRCAQGADVVDPRRLRHGYRAQLFSPERTRALLAGR